MIIFHIDMFVYHHEWHYAYDKKNSMLRIFAEIANS